MNVSSSDSPKQPTQFSLRAVFAVMTGIGVMFGAIHWLGAATVIIAVPLVLTVLFIIAANLSARRQLHVEIFGLGLLGLLTAGCLLSMLLPRAGSYPGSTRRSQCRNNLKMIGLGLQTYADVYGRFPPAYIADAEGRPMHSWRVLILPYIEHKPLHKLYDFNEPWDGPHNRLLAKNIPPCYQCPSDPALPGTANTSYVAITGPQTLWAGDTAAEFEDINDGTSNTLAVVEIAGSGINWMEPRDLPFSALNLGVNAPQGGGISSTHPGEANVVFCDGSTRIVQSTIPVELLKAFATKSGGETIDEEY